jgi:cysteine desulfurase
MDFFNPSSIHQGGQLSRMIIETARDLIRQAISAPKASIAFTSGATESNNSVLMSPFWSYINTERHNGFIPELIISAVEHPAVMEVAKRLESLGVTLSVISPRSDSQFHVEDFINKVTDKTKLISVMAVNNETGVCLPIQQIFKEAKLKNPKILCHTDAVQLFGKQKIDFQELDVDYMSISAHKIGGLSGVGAVVMKDGVSIDPVLVGGPQETRRRPGTENVIGIFSFGEAVRALIDEGDSRQAKLRENAKRFTELLKASIPEVVINFSKDNTIGNTVSVLFPGIATSDMVVALDLNGVFASSGSACSSGKISASPVLLAHGFSEKDALQTVRFSVHHYLSEQDIELAVKRIASAYYTMQAKDAA